MTSPDPRWLAVYGAAFVHEVTTALKHARDGLTDDLVDRAREAAEALADWERERREDDEVFPESVRVQLKNLCGILNDGAGPDTAVRVRQVALALSSLCEEAGVGGHPVPEVTVDISEHVRKLGDFFSEGLPDVQAFAAGGPAGRAMAEARNKRDDDPVEFEPEQEDEQ